MHVGIGDNSSTQGSLSVYYEQDLLVVDEAKPLESAEIRRETADDSLQQADSNNNNNNNDSNVSNLNSSSFVNLNESIESSVLDESSEHNSNDNGNNNSNKGNATPPPVVRRRKNTTRPRSRERSFVYAASGAVVVGARSVARTFKRMSLIESGSGGGGGSIRERATHKSGSAQDGVVQLQANANIQRYNSTP